MSEGDTHSSVHDAVSTKVGERAADAFGVLGNETRLAILLTLWEAYDPTAEDNVLSFSELRDGVGMRDSGQFNYHLDQLVDRFVHSTEDGYELAQAGHNIVQTVLGDVGKEEPVLETSDATFPCPHCESPLDLFYENRRLKATCSECASQPEDGQADGTTVISITFPPAGVADRTAGEVVFANSHRAYRKIAMRVSGVCPQCAGVVDAWFETCDDHDPTDEQVCPVCGYHSPVRVWFVCETCKDSQTGPPGLVLQSHPAGIKYMQEVGYPFDMEPGEVSYVERYQEVTYQTETTNEIVSENPLRVRSTARHEDAGTLSVLLNEDVEILDIEREGE